MVGSTLLVFPNRHEDFQRGHGSSSWLLTRRCGGLDGQRAGGREKGHCDLRAAHKKGATPAVGRGGSSAKKEEDAAEAAHSMAHFEAAAPPAADSTAKWPHDSLSHHLGVHTPLQVSRCTDAAQAGAASVYHAMHSSPWQSPGLRPPPGTGQQQPGGGMYRPGACFPQQTPIQQYAAAIQQQQQQNGGQNGSFTAYMNEEANRKLIQDWHSANNNKLNETFGVEKSTTPGWAAANGGGVISPARPQAQHGVALLSPPLQQPQGSVLMSPTRTNFLPTSLGNIAAPQAVHGLPSTFLAASDDNKIEAKDVKIEIGTDFTPSPKSEERKSAESQQQDTTSYDASGSLSVTDSDDLAERQLDVEIGRDGDGSPIVVSNEEEGERRDQSTPHLSNSDTDTPASTNKSNVTPNSNHESEGDETNPKERVNGENGTVVAGTSEPKGTQEKDDENSPQSLLLNFSQKSFNSLSKPLSENGGDSSKSTPTKHTEDDRPVQQPTSTSFCRPPGLGPPTAFPASVLAHSSQQPLVCPICGFSCTSKFHYNSHMNTHGDHQCTMCDYTSRTEGRLKRHMRESHTAEEQLAAGLEVDSHAAGSNSTPLASTPSATAVVTSTSSLGVDNSLSTTMASLMDVANLAAAAVAASNGEKSSECSAPPPTPFPSALDQIRAFTEKASLLPDPSVNLASALGVMSQAMLASGVEPNGAGSAGSGGSGASPNRSPEQRRSSGGKPKTYKCKQCTHISMSKEEQWNHARSHIPVEKQMCCPKCNFVTEYKHHLEYHLRNHIGSKPFQCKKCSYTCVNKSMLNSHMKSHTNVYQFRCRDCTYATKYCHSLKLHLRKYNHRRAAEGPEEAGPSGANGGTPSSPPTPMSMASSMDASSALQRLSDSFTPMDISSPQPQTTLAQTLGLAPMVNQPPLNYASQMIMRQQQMDMESIMRMQHQQQQAHFKCQLCDFQCGAQDELMRHNMAHLINQQQPPMSQPPMPITSLYQQFSGLPLLPTSLASVVAAAAAASVAVNGNSDSSKAENGNHDVEKDVHVEVKVEDPMVASPEGDSACSSGSPMGSSKGSCDEGDNPTRSRKRKAKAFKLDQIAQRLQKGSPGAEESHRPETSNGEPPGYRSLVNPAPLQVSSTIANLPQPIPTNPAQHFGAMPVENGGNLNIFQQACLAHLNAIQTQAKQRDSDVWRFQCAHCRMAFQDQALYHIHMGYHGYEHPFKCNRCGATQMDALQFNLHLLQASHE